MGYKSWEDKNLKPKVCIIGGAGYVGSSLARYFLNNYDVRILDVKSPPEELVKNVEYFYCDIFFVSLNKRKRKYFKKTWSFFINR